MDQSTGEGTHARPQQALVNKRLKGRRTGRSDPGPEVFSVALGVVDGVRPPRFGIGCRWARVRSSRGVLEDGLMQTPTGLIPGEREVDQEQG